jgi:hypothetical protein
MQGFAPRVTSIKGLSQRNRLPRLGKIRLGLKVKNKNIKNPGCACGPEEGCFKCSYPAETPYFVVPAEVARVYGEKPIELKVKVPVNSMDVVFPRAYKYYGSSRGLRCTGDLEKALRMNEKTNALEEVPCPCQFLDRECKPRGVLNVLLPEVSLKGVYQITTGSWNSIIDIASGLEYVECLMGRFAMVPLILKRIPTPTFKGGKQTHHTLQILLDTDNPEFPKKLPVLKQEHYALPPAEEIRPDLDGPIATEEELSVEGPLIAGAEPGAEDTSGVVTPIKQIVVRTEKNSQGRAVKKFKIMTEAGIYITSDESVKNTALAAMKAVDFVEIEFVLDPREGNLIKSLKRAMDEKTQ